MNLNPPCQSSKSKDISVLGKTNICLPPLSIKGQRIEHTPDQQRSIYKAQWFTHENILSCFRDYVEFSQPISDMVAQISIFYWLRSDKKIKNCSPLRAHLSCVGSKFFTFCSTVQFWWGKGKVLYFAPRIYNQNLIILGVRKAMLPNIVLLPSVIFYASHCNVSGPYPPQYRHHI
jgi:hypothetical protein